MDDLTRPERYAHKAQVMSNQCASCRNRVDTGYQFDGVPVFDCARGLTPPRKRVCQGFSLDEGDDQ